MHQTMHAYKTTCNISAVHSWDVTQTIVAPDGPTAERISARRAKTWFSHDKHRGKKATVTVSKCEEITGPKGEIIVLMDGFRKVDIGVHALRESTVIRLKEGTDFRVEAIYNYGGSIDLEGYTDGAALKSHAQLHHVEEDDLALLADSLRSLIGEDAPAFLRQALLLMDLIGGDSPFGNHIPARFLDLPGIACDASATRISDDSGTAVLLHWDLYGDYSRAMVIPEDEFRDTDRIIEAIEAFVKG